MDATNGDFAANLADGLARELLIRLQAGQCDKCGRSAVTIGELETIRKYLSDNEVRQLRDEANRRVPQRSILPELPFTPPNLIA